MTGEPQQTTTTRNLDAELIDECPDGHRCENGSKCIEKPGDEDNYFCDCDEAELDAAYAGLYCEHKATEYCAYGGAISRSSFCTNKGECVEVVAPDAKHMGCRCKEGYEGEHCQFVEGTAPEDWYQENNSNGSNSLTSPKTSSGSGGGGGGGSSSAGIIVGILLAVVIVVLIAAVYIRRQTIRRINAKEPVVSGEDGDSETPSKGVTGADMNLEADGAVLQEAVANNRSLDDDGLQGVKAEDSEVI